MRNLWLAFAAASLAASPALAEDSLMASRFGNTEHVETSLGHANMYFAPDHTFTGKASALLFSLPLKGTWKLDGSTLCLNYESPPPGESNPSCSTITSHAIGDTWDSKGRTVTLLKGIQ
jgi:hypothetical protein